MTEPSNVVSPSTASEQANASDVFSRAISEATQNAKSTENNETSVAARRLRYLSQIGLALSAERDIRRLLAMILTASRELTLADGGTLYIVERDGQTGEKKLFFRASQNDSIVVDTNMSFSVTSSSLAGYAALSGEVLCFDDVYHLPEDAPYKFNPRFDSEHGYRTKSVLVVPMQNHNGEIIGVLQLINRKKSRQTILQDASVVEREVLPFDSDLIELARTLASQAAVALNNNLLLREIETLFESFVVASSSAIEDRDPTTSGHSRRVTLLTLALARAVDEATEGPYQNTHFSPAQMRELRYASLLHDFGKIGVREAILTKSHKVETPQFEAILSHILVLQGQKEAEAAQEKLQVAMDASLSATAKIERIEAIDKENCDFIAQLQSDAHFLELLNVPPIKPISDEEWEMAQQALIRLRGMTFVDVNGFNQPILTAEQASALAVRRGTLTPDEFRQIQDHAQMSWDFLRQIPWTPELENIPPIAQAHHERLDGSGYPLGLNKDTIPLGAKMMGISDVYDALTASDRPYKRAMTPQEAIKILQQDTAHGKFDPDLLDIFIKREVWKAVLGAV